MDPTGNARDCVKDAYNQIRADNPNMAAAEAHKLAMEQVGKKPIAETPTIPEGYFQDDNGRWHRPNGEFASNTEIGLPDSAGMSNRENTGEVHQVKIQRLETL